jgi:hypothetical protein
MNLPTGFMGRRTALRPIFAVPPFQPPAETTLFPIRAASASGTAIQTKMRAKTWI